MRIEIKWLIAWMIVGSVLFLATGCKRTEPTPAPIPAPIATPTPKPHVTSKPVVLDADAEIVKRARLEETTFWYRLIQNGQPLDIGKVQVGALELPQQNGEKLILVPLRATGEAAGFKVDWVYPKRRVMWDDEAIAPPLTIIDDLAYLPRDRFEKLMQHRTRGAYFRLFRFDDTTGFIEIGGKIDGSSKAAIKAKR